MKQTKPNRILGLDNFERDTQQEQLLNTLFESVFKQENAQEILRYLKQITVGLIQRRVNKGRSQRIVQEKKDVR